MGGEREGERENRGGSVQRERMKEGMRNVGIKKCVEEGERGGQRERGREKDGKGAMGGIYNV